MKKIKINLRGFPGWHTECVVMSAKKLGVPFDIHCGGVDHILIHHTNEIAQAEAAFGKILAKFWLHGEFMLVEGEKMAKSKGNIFLVEDLLKKGFNPLAYRLLCLCCHYRSKLNFSWKCLEASQNALDNLYEKVGEMEIESRKQKIENRRIKDYKEKFLNFINDDLDTPKALALMWQVVKDKKLKMEDKRRLLLDFDRVFGLNLAKVKKLKIPQKIKELVKIREKYRKEGNWQKADEMRRKIKNLGYQIEDTKEGPKIKPSSENLTAAAK